MNLLQFAIPVILGGTFTLAGVLLTSLLQARTEHRNWKRKARTDSYAEFLTAVDAVLFAESIVQVLRASRDAHERGDVNIPPPGIFAESGLKLPEASATALDAKRRLGRASATVQLIGGETVSKAHMRLKALAQTFDISSADVTEFDGAWNEFVATARSDLSIEAFTKHQPKRPSRLLWRRRAARS